MTPKLLILPEPQDLDMLQKMRDAVVAIYNDVTASDSRDDHTADDSSDNCCFYSLTATYL